MVFSKEFLDLQLSFAESVQRLSGMPLERALLEYTNLYVRFGLGRKFDPEHEAWRNYLADLRAAGDARECTHRFYLKNAEANTAASAVARFGCFSYALHGSNVIRLHFRNLKSSGSSPLAAAQVGERRAELEALFKHAKSTAATGAVVLGISWLYQLEAYRRLFPRAYSAASRVVRGRFQSMSLWGQFLDHRGEVKGSMKQQFTSALAQHPTLADVDACFPLQPLTVQAPAQAFYEFYGV